jgi:hypothetical protein
MNVAAAGPGIRELTRHYRGPSRHTRPAGRADPPDPPTRRTAGPPAQPAWRPQTLRAPTTSRRCGTNRRSLAGRSPGPVPLSMFVMSSKRGSELGQLGAGRRDPYLLRAEVDNQDGLIFHAHDPAEAVLVVSHLVLHVELLSRRGGGRRLEGACGQKAPSRGGGRLHMSSMRPAAPLVPQSVGREQQSCPENTEKPPSVRDEKDFSERTVALPSDQDQSARTCSACGPF